MSRAPFFDPHLVIPNDIATKRGEDCSGTQLYHHANFDADRHRCRRDIPGYTENADTVVQNAYWRLRLSYNKCGRRVRPIRYALAGL